jgi:hypothetical protein
MLLSSAEGVLATLSATLPSNLYDWLTLGFALVIAVFLVYYIKVLCKKKQKTKKSKALSSVKL